MMHVLMVSVMAAGRKKNSEVKVAIPKYRRICYKSCIQTFTGKTVDVLASKYFHFIIMLSGPFQSNAYYIIGYNH